ncbi:ABC transporter substrate-binding protein [Mesorhizobium shangrilense]|uniref:ABC transporter substrate-binding protein n=1 Tax=Mesorhizobium shangrilense TaxID=460060 RepID=A0ABV2DLI6_9HYPH
MKSQNASIMKIVGFAAAALAIAAVPAKAAELGAVDTPIKLAINEWTGQHITTRVAGEILTRMGYKVEYVTAGYFPQMTALQDDTITATLEIWSSNIGEVMNEALKSGNVVKLGDLGLAISETWYYNDAAQAACPGLPDWKALKGCADKFAVAETYPDGRFLDYPVEWGTTNAKRIKALDLPFKSVPAGSEGALVVEIKAAEEKKEPILVMFFSPHWLFADVNLHMVALPPYFDGCYEDASLGVNPNATYDCDWQRGHVDKLAWIGMKEKWPAAYAFLSQYQMTKEAQVPMLAAVDSKGENLQAVVSKWVDSNESVWKPWVNAAVK